MIKLFSFCCLIGKNTEIELLYALEILLKSLDFYVKDYELILYTNFDIGNKINNKSVKLITYYDKTKNNYYNNIWLNLSFNKINIYKDLYDEFNENYIWIDLDTIVMSNISYLNEIDNFFIEHGGNCTKGQTIISNYFDIPLNKSIQGAIWKINIDLYFKLMSLLNELNSLNLKVEYDIQGLVAYYIFHKLNGNIDDNNIYILGNNYKKNTINGLGIWSNDPNRNRHVNLEGLTNLYIENNIMKTRYYPNMEIHFVMFTFDSLKEVSNTDEFKKLFSFN